MVRNPLIGLVAAALIALAGMVTATPGNALACPGGLSENCARVGAPFGAAGSGQGMFALPGIGVAPNPVVPGTAAPRIEFAAGNCAAAAAQAAASQGGQVIGAPQTVQQGGRTMCVVTVLIKDPTGKSPPTRRQIVVPAN